MAWSAAARAAAKAARAAHSTAKVATKVGRRMSISKGAVTAAGRAGIAKAIKLQRSGKTGVNMKTMLMAASSTKARNSTRRKGR